MSGPAAFMREFQSLDDMIAKASGPGWAGLEKMFAPAKVADSFEPQDDMKKFLAAMVRTQVGREFIQWIADLTVRAPYPHVGTLRETAALAAAKHEARAAVGHVIFAAIAAGDLLLDKPKEPGT